MVAKQIYVIAYDISNNKRRYKVAKILEEYGLRVNKSVFECLVLPNAYKILVAKVNEKINLKTDSIVFYPICRSCFEKKKISRNVNYDPIVVKV